MTTTFPISFGATVLKAITGTTSRIALGKGANDKNSVRLYNSGAVTIFVVEGDVTVEAAVTDLPIPPGMVEVFTAAKTTTHIAGITASGSGTLYCTTGDGV